MFIGHYAIAFAVKKRASYIPLWILFIAVQSADILWSALIVFGVERVVFDMEKSFFLRATYEYYPYSHSFLAIAVVAALVYLVVKKLKDSKWAFWISITVMSHWFMDAIVHIPDLPLVADRFKIGLGLWQYPLASIRTEIILLGLGTAIYLSRDKLFSRRHIRTIIFLLLVFLFYIVSYFAPAVEPKVLQVATANIVIYLLVALGGFWIEKKRAVRN